MVKARFALLLILAILLAGCSSVSASPAARIVTGVVTNVVSTLFKKLWSMKSTRKMVISTRPMMKFEGGYTVETVFDGSKLGIEPHSIGVSADGDILVLDSENSNIYKISNPLTLYSRPRLLAGSAEGHSGHIDAKLREARMNHPKGLTVDHNGNVYVADTMNMAIRKITDSGVVTIAGGRSNRGGHVDGPSEDAKFSDNFDVVYMGSSCSLLVVDRGNRAIREIQLHESDCSPQEDINLHIGIAVLAAACFFGYMLALLQRRIAYLIRGNEKEHEIFVETLSPETYRKTRSVRPPLIPPDNEYDKEEEGFFTSMGRLILSTSSSIFDIFTGILPTFQKKTVHHHRRHCLHQESFVIPRGDEPPPPPPVETREHTPNRTYPHPTTTKYTDIDKDGDKIQHKQSQGSYIGYQQQQLRRYLQHQQKHHPLKPQTYYQQQQQEQINGEPNDIVFGAMQEQDGRRESMVIKAVDYGDPYYGNQNVRSRYNYMSYAAYGY